MLKSFLLKLTLKAESLDIYEFFLDKSLPPQFSIATEWNYHVLQFCMYIMNLFESNLYYLCLCNVVLDWVSCFFPVYLPLCKIYEQTYFPGSEARFFSRWYGSEEDCRFAIFTCLLSAVSNHWIMEIFYYLTSCVHHRHYSWQWLGMPEMWKYQLLI